jgi:hypothetical protein
LRDIALGFELRTGKFVEFCRRAETDPSGTYVFIIDEINRGNLSKILGELLLLIESDKRDPKWAISLASSKLPFHVPANVNIMGLMNTADRSLAVVDYALRRRFAFVDLQPKLGSPKLRTHLLHAGVSPSSLDTMIARIGALNDAIVSDTASLGLALRSGTAISVRAQPTPRTRRPGMPALSGPKSLLCSANTGSTLRKRRKAGRTSF